MGDFHFIFKGQVRKDFTRFKVVVDLIEEVRVAHSSSSYHNSISPDFFDTLFGFLNAADISVSDERNLSQSLGHIVQGFKIGMASIHLLTGATVHS